MQSSPSQVKKLGFHEKPLKSFIQEVILTDFNILKRSLWLLVENGQWEDENRGKEASEGASTVFQVTEGGSLAQQFPWT